MPEHLAQFIRVEEAAKRTGLSGYSIDRRICAGEISVYRDPRDRRRRLIAIGDLDRLTNVVPFVQDQSSAEQLAG